MRGITMRTFDIDMPSRGLLGTPSVISLREMTLKERKILFDRPRFEQIVKMVGDCITDAKVSVYDLYLYDYMTLFIKLREITMDSEYSFNIRCKQCGQTQRVDIDLSELDVLEASEGSSPTFDVEVVDDDDNILSTYTIKHITVRDQIELNKRLLKKKSARKTFTEGDEFTFSLAYRIVEIDGESVRDPEMIITQLENLPASLVDKLEEGIAAQDFGIRFSQAHECHNCMFMDVYPINITSEFFFRRKEFGTAHRTVG